MTGCDDCVAHIQLYMDGELQGQGLEEFRRHLGQCSVCRQELQAEEELSSLLHRAKPLYTAPESLRHRVRQAIEETGSGPADHQRRSERKMSWPVRFAGQRVHIWQIAAIAAVLLVVGYLSTTVILRHARTNEYLAEAVEAHRAFLDGSLPLEVQSDSPGVVTKWFAGRVPFAFRLPESGDSSGQEAAYKLVGGRLVNYKGGATALVAYQMQQQKISLLVASSNSAIAEGGDEVHSGKLVFHYNKRSNFTIISWTTHGLTYALVSSLPGSGKQSCLVCHQNMPNGDQFTARR